MKSGTVAVKGLDEFRKELRKLDEPELVQALKDVNYAVASLVVDRAKGNASTRMQQRAAATLTPSRQAARAQVNLGGSKFPGAAGAEFGAGQNQPRVGPSGRNYTGHNQFEAWRGSGSDAGYFLYPAIRDSTDEIVEMYGDAIEDITRRAFPDGI